MKYKQNLYAKMHGILPSFGEFRKILHQKILYSAGSQKTTSMDTLILLGPFSKFYKNWQDRNKGFAIYAKFTLQ
jgi:hypothetical protein